MVSVQGMLDNGNSPGGPGGSHGLSPSPAPSHIKPPSQSQSQQQKDKQSQQNRILACVMCQQRKVKCNRKFPCNNCIRVGVSCVPATLNPRRRRRRFPERELLDRVRDYESLLKQNNVRFESLFQKETADGVLVEDDAPGASTTSHARKTQAEKRHGNHDDGHVDMNSGGEGRETPALSEAHSPAPIGKVNEAVNFWKAIRNGFRDRDRNKDDDDDDDNESSYSDDAEIRNHIMRGLWQRQLGSTGSLFLRRNCSSFIGPNQALVPRQNLQSFHPGPAQIFQLWQTFLNNVDPLLKITHTPTLQKRIVEAVTNLAGIDAGLEALMFGIYCAAVHSMAPSDCKATFGTSKSELLDTYHPACEQALVNCGFLRTSDRECLSAFFLYMLSLGHHLDPRSTYSMLGVCTRLAKTMRIDQESANARLPPLEGELRRRLWWALVLFDARISELAQSPPALDPTWDCRVPTNANDSDFRAEMKEPSVSSLSVQSKAYASEAIFAVVRAETGNALRYMEYYVALSNPTLRHMARRMPAGTTASSSAAPSPAASTNATALDFAEIEALDAMINDRYLQHCDPENGLHCMTIWFARGVIAKGRLIKYFAKFSNFDRPEKSAASTPSSTHQAAEIIESIKDRALDDALMVIKSDTVIMTSPLTRSYRWLQHLYFPMPAYIFVTQDLARRISGDRATAAWAAMHNHYEARFAASDSEDHYMFKMFAGTILQAWDQCEERCRAAGETQPVPEMVVKIKAELAVEMEASKTAAATATSQTQGQTGQTPGQGAAGLDDLGLSTNDLLNFGPVSASTPSIFGALGGGSGSAFASGGSSTAVPGVSGVGTETATAGIFSSPNLGAIGYGGLGGFGGGGSFIMPGMPGGAAWPPQAWSWMPPPSQLR